MHAWASGYVSDIEYTHGFHRELSPSFLRYVCLTQGVRPPSLASGANYCDLGCGQGISATIVAATHPHIKVWGLDFNPTHIANARRLAQEGGLSNATFLDCSFEQALEKPAGTFPEFDYIVLHGVYSWVSDANRRMVVKFIDRHLKPGGLVYVSYNSLPGWSAIAPLQRLMREHANRRPGRSDAQAKAALEFIRQLAAAKAHYFTHNAAVTTHLEQRAADNPLYLAHEYLNEHWSPMYHADVARDLDAARLTFVASAGLIENNDRLSLPPAIAAMCKESRDPEWRETLRDYARDQRFRRDIFLRGPSPMKPVEHSEALTCVRVTLMGDRAHATHAFDTPNGKMKFSDDLYVPILDALGERPHSIGELAALPALQGKPGPSVVEAVNVLINFGQVHPLLEGERSGETGGGQRLNKAISARIRHGDILGHIAVPAAGTGVQASYVDLVAILALAEGMKPDPKEVARFGWSLMQRTGQRMVRDRTRLETPEDNIAELEAHLQRIYARQLKVWKMLDVV
jgi:SAM-dependent methyltransferase